MKPILVVSATRNKKFDTKIYQSVGGISANHSAAELKLNIVENNKEGLPTVYNRFLDKKYLKKHDIILFVHDDVFIDDLKLKGKLYNNLNQMYDIVGLAGCVKPVIKKPVLWHVMSHRDNLRGFVHHEMQITEDQIATRVTSFGYTPCRVVIIDGLFMAVNLKRVISSGWKFNEQFDFHHYDIAACLDANKLKLKVGVAPIHVIHGSPGLMDMNDTKWLQSQDKFLDLYT
tara:strand:+ start:322 stop:1011 length:690 start_codon:yes stop_codon:yes gene_type:complete